MNLFSHLKIKYRLLIVVFLPTLLLLGFLFSFLRNEYETVTKIKLVDQTMVLMHDILNLNQKLHIEGIVSKSALVHEKSTIRTDLTTARSQVDNALTTLHDNIANISDEAERNWLNDAVKPIISKLEPLLKRRDEIDTKSVAPKLTADFYNSIESNVSDAINKMMDKIKDYPMTRRLYLVLSIAQAQIASGNIANIVLDGLFESKLTPEEYQSLLEEYGKQLGAREIAYDIAIPTEEALMNDSFSKEAWRQVDVQRNSVIAKGPTGPYEVKPQEWFQNTTSKGEIYDNLMLLIIELNQKSVDRITSEFYNYLWMVVLATLAILGFVLLIVLASLRGLAKKLEDEVGVLSNSGEEILRSISEASSGVVETAAAVTETTTTVEELKQTAQVSAEKAKNVAEVSEEALNTLQTSEKTVTDTIEWMNRIHEGMGTISESIVKLSDHGKMIREIIDAVNDLAEQSHLLAVNAAIEAAKAGEQGKGFSVVAQEVRSLADQSKQATVQVRNILNDIQNATNAAVMATEQGGKAVSNGLAQSAQTGDSIRSLAQGINNVAQAAAQISLSSQQQLIGVNQVTTAMANIKTASDQHVDHMRQIEGGVQGLNTVGKSLKEQVVQFKL